MPQGYTTLQDMALQSASNETRVITDEIGDLAPEMLAMPTIKVASDNVQVPARTTVPKMHFRNANGGVSLSKAGYKLNRSEGFNLSSVILIDRVVARKHPQGEAGAITEATIAHGKGGLQSVAHQMIYGKRLNVDGFAGVADLMDDYLTLSANPTYTDEYLKTPANMKVAQADNSGTSVYIMKVGQEHAYLFYGNNSTMEFGKIQEETIKLADGTYQKAITRSADACVGFGMPNRTACVRIKNITPEQPLTDELLAKASRMVGKGGKAIILMSSLAAETLEKERKKAGYMPIQPDYKGEVYVGQASTFRGMPIIETNTILDDESDASLAILAAETDYKRKQYSGTIK